MQEHGATLAAVLAPELKALNGRRNLLNAVPSTVRPRICVMRWPRG